MTQRRQMDTLLDRSKGQPLFVGALTAEDKIVGRMNPRERFIYAAPYRAEGATVADFTVRGAYNQAELKAATNTRPGQVTIGTKGLAGLRFGRIGATGITANSNGAVACRGRSLLGKDSYTFFVAYSFGAPDAANNANTAGGAVLGEAIDNAGMILSIDASGRLIFDPQRESGSFAVRTDPAVINFQGKTGVLAIRHDVVAGTVQLYNDTASAPLVAATGITERLTTGIIKLGGTGDTLQQTPALGIDAALLATYSSAISDALLAEEMSRYVAMVK